MPEIIWQRIGSGDYKAEVDGFILRVKCMDRDVWWWTVYDPEGNTVGDPWKPNKKTMK